LVIVNQPWVELPDNPFGQPKIKAKGGEAIWLNSSLVFLFGNQKGAGTNKITATKDKRSVKFAIRTKVSVMKNHINGLGYEDGKIIVTPHGFLAGKEAAEEKVSIENYKKEYADKENRRLTMNEEKKESYYGQKERLKQYLEEMFIRQIGIDNHECDDLIAYYTQISQEEKITILSSDKDLTQLITSKVHMYSPIVKEWVTDKHKVKLGTIEVPIANVKLVKILLGDKSDNIEGIYSFGEKKLVKYFPEVVEQELNIDYICTRAQELLDIDDTIKPLKNLLSGTTKSGTYGKEYYDIREKIVSLSNPLMTEEAKKEVELYYSEDMDPEGRGYKNLMKMMIEDGFFKYLPKQDDAWVEFLQPIMKLTRKEKKRYNNNN